MTSATEYFGLFLTALRRDEYNLPLSDSATAQLLADALVILSPEDDNASSTANDLAYIFQVMAENSELATDNGSNPS